MRLMLAIPSLGCGGSERVMSTLAAEWAAAGHDVSLVTFDPPETDFFSVPSAKRIVIGATGSGGLNWIRANLARLKAFRQAVRLARPDVVVSFLYTMNLIAIWSARTVAPVVVAERTDPRYAPVERWQYWLRRLLYPRAAGLVVQTAAVREGWARKVARRVPSFVIPNPVPPPLPGLPLMANYPYRIVAGVGRLEHGKGFEVLIDAFAQAARHRPEWRLVILGEGPERNALEARAASQGVGDRVVLAGRGDSAALFRQAEVFASASRLEGFPNALLEAMAHGLAVVATDCASGPSEIVRDGVDGFLVAVDDRNGLAAALAQLLEDDDVRSAMGSRATAVIERFGVREITSQWEDVFSDVARQNGMAMALAGRSA